MHCMDLVHTHYPLECIQDSQVFFNRQQVPKDVLYTPLALKSNHFGWRGEILAQPYFLGTDA